MEKQTKIYFDDLSWFIKIPIIISWIYGILFILGFIGGIFGLI